MEFDWDAGNTEHLIEDHRVQPEEAVEVLYNRPVTVKKGMVKGEMRYRVVGRTDRGRLLTVVFTLRGNKVRIVTAFDSGGKDWRKYQGRKGKNA